MTKFVLEIEMENDAFAEDPAGEVKDILSKVFNEIFVDGLNAKAIKDTNGNKVGFYEVIEG